MQHLVVQIPEALFHLLERLPLNLVVSSLLRAPGEEAFVFDGVS